MPSSSQLATAISDRIHRNFLWLLLICYVAAAWTPGFGLWIRQVSFGPHELGQPQGLVTLPMLMLALLLLNAGLGVDSSQLHGLRHFWLVLTAGLVANLLVPLAFIFAVTPAMGIWLPSEKVQSIVMGLALIASVPIAGASTAWSQNTDGNLVVSLGLVILSTILSPLTAPVTLRLVGLLATGEHAQDLGNMADLGTGIFLVLCVVIPSMLGIFIRWLLGEGRMAQAKPFLKLLNWINLMLLIYSNASTSLPSAVNSPEPDLLLTTLGVAVLLCATAFSAGWGVGRLLGADLPERTALMFGLGMNNNGTALVLASLALAHYPQVMLPIITYNLVQHVVAGGAAWLIRRREAPDDDVTGTLGVPSA